MAPARAAERARRAILDMPWSFVHQVHGTEVVRASRARAVPDADAMVTDDDGLALALLGADCALIGLSSAEGIRGAAHAGWRGLLGGVIEGTAAAMRALGATDLVAARSPAIYPECYPFSEADLAPLRARYGPGVLGTARDGSPALDLPAAVNLALERAGVEVLEELAGCTSCDPRFYSWRRGADSARHALVVHAQP
jgi:copper oxidase (laccase) domain-containing protein